MQATDLPDPVTHYGKWRSQDRVGRFSRCRPAWLAGWRWGEVARRLRTPGAASNQAPHSLRTLSIHHHPKIPDHAPRIEA